MSLFNIEIVTPTQIIKKDKVSYLRCPGMDGLFGVLSGHRDALIALNLGCLLYTSPSPRDRG